MKKMSNAIKISEAGNLKRDNRIGRLLSNLANLAVDSSFNLSLKGVTGPKKLYQIVQEKFKYAPSSLTTSTCKKPEDAKLVVEKMRIEVEEMLEDMAKLKQQDETLSKCAEEKGPQRKVPNEGSKKLGVSVPEKKRIFIRSRL